MRSFIEFVLNLCHLILFIHNFRNKTKYLLLKQTKYKENSILIKLLFNTNNAFLYQNILISIQFSLNSTNYLLLFN